jgi:hypothetical protein
MTERHVTMIEEFLTPPAGLSADGQLLAVRDPADLYRLDVWDAEGKRLGGFVPYDRKTPVEWIGWGAGAPPGEVSRTRPERPNRWVLSAGLRSDRLQPPSRELYTPRDAGG